MKTKVFTLMVLLLAGVASAQNDTTYWTSGGFGSLTFSQVQLDNWAGGGESSISINAIVNAFADYKKDRTTWENNLDLGYGLIRQGNNGSLQKSDDKIQFTTKAGYKIVNGNEKWYYSALLDFRSQFDQGITKVELADGTKQDSVISKFMAPGYLTVGLGVDYKPNSKLSFNYIPLTGKFTFVMDQALADAGAYGVPAGNKARGEIGSFFRAKYKDEVVKNVTIESRLELFANYVVDFPTVDVNWQTAVNMKINSFMTASFNYQMIYDKDISGEIQNKSVFGVGLSHAIGAKKG